MTEKNYKLQITNYKQIPNYKIQITKKEAPFGHFRVFVLVIRVIDVSPQAFKTCPKGTTTHHFVILSLWFVCNLYFVICNFETPLPYFSQAVRKLR